MTAGTREAGGTDLSWLLAGVVSTPPVMVRDLTLDSRAVGEGDAFVALGGRATHGLDHAADAIARGASVVLWDPAEGRAASAMLPADRLVAVPGLRARLGALADRFYGQPSASVQVAGITGTNGKTTSAWLYAECHGQSGAYMGTLGIGRPPVVRAGEHTTPDVIAVHRSLRTLADARAGKVAMEVSSHALDQGRVDGVRMPLTAFTNLTRDHLDYHGTMAAYGAAKERLFALPGVEQAVINVGDPFGAELAQRLPGGVQLTAVCTSRVSAASRRFVVADRVDCQATGIELIGESHAGRFRLRSSLVGAFNAENLLLVLGLLLASDMPLAAALDVLADAPAPPGRMEAFELGVNGPILVVDYAHTPDALAKALSALRAHTAGRLICVFGCGGDRDPGKRAQMAAVAEAGADSLVVTDDNPRTEDPDRIVAMITQALTGRVPVLVERDRALAIRRAAAAAGPGDTILVAGKGHEDYQIYGTERRAYSDRDVARALAGGVR